MAPLPHLTRLRRLWGGLLLAIGWVLSPLTWWNDALVNLPISYLAASIVSWPFPALFEAALIATYWATNVAGFVLMHRGAVLLGMREKEGSEWSFRKSLLLALLYTLVVILLLALGWIRPLHLL